MRAGDSIPMLFGAVTGRHRMGIVLALSGNMSSVPSPAREVRDASVSDLVSGIVSDTGDLLGAHVESIRNELSEGLSDLRDRILSAVLAAAAAIVASTMVLIAVAVSLIAVGLAPWIAYWIVAAVAVIALALMIRRAAKPKQGRTAGDPVEALQRAKNDASWLADKASDAVT